MPDEIFGFTADQVELISEIVRRELQNPINIRGRQRIKEDIPNAPDAYIVKVTTQTGTGGVAALAEGATTPDNTVCEVYRIIVTAGVPTLEEVTGLTKNVYNIAPTGVSENAWALIQRDKFGSWIFTSSFSESGGGTVVDATHTVSGKVNLVSQYLGAGQKIFDEIALASTGGSLNARDPIMRSEVVSINAVPIYHLMIENNTSPYSSFPPTIVVPGNLAFSVRNDILDTDVYWIADGTTFFESGGSALLEWKLLNATGANAAGLTMVYSATVPTIAASPDVYIMASGEIICSGPYSIGTGTGRYQGITSTSSVLVLPYNVRGGITTAATSLADPNADRIPFWDDSNSVMAWLAPDGTSISITGTTISATGTSTEDIQDIIGAMVTDSPTIDFTYDDTAGTITAIVIDASISNTKLATMKAYSVKVNLTGGTAAPTDADVADFTEKASPVDDDTLWLWDSEASGAQKKVKKSSLLAGVSGLTQQQVCKIVSLRA